MAELDTAKFEEFISAYPIYEYRILDTSDLSVATRVRQICRQECERYGSTWACPPAVGTLEECEKRIRSYGKAVFFSRNLKVLRQSTDLTVNLLSVRFPELKRLLTSAVREWIPARRNVWNCTVIQR